MTPFFTRLLGLLRTRLGILFIGIGLLLLLLGGISSCKSKATPSVRPEARRSLQQGSNLHISVARRIEPVKSSPLKTNSIAVTNNRPTFYSVHVDLPIDTAAQFEDYAPFGRFVQCQLVNSIESIAIATPIVGLTVEDVWHNGEIIIPVGTEVHSKVQMDRARERLGSTGPWTFVFHEGEELVVSGTMLDREYDANGAGWGITDGSAGVRGQILKSDSLAEIKLFLATALSGMSSGLQQTRSSIFGFQARNTFQNAGLAGASSVLDEYAQQVLEVIKRDGLYVRVPAGKQFYVYVTQTIDKSKARVGASGLQNAFSEQRTNRVQPPNRTPSITNVYGP